MYEFFEVFPTLLSSVYLILICACLFSCVDQPRLHGRLFRDREASSTPLLKIIQNEAGHKTTTKGASHASSGLIMRTTLIKFKENSHTRTCVDTNCLIKNEVFFSMQAAQLSSGSVLGLKLARILHSCPSGSTICYFSDCMLLCKRLHPDDVHASQVVV
jgi:hypothetical protein